VVHEKLAHKPGLNELFTPQELADGAPFYFELVVFVHQLEKARKAAGLTLAQVAAKSGIAEETLCRLERGAVTNPTWQTLGRYAVAVGAKPVLTLSTEPPAAK
jgi:DNA-binding XRE family transcriptional regulator